jgi:homospermidine synthase
MQSTDDLAVVLMGESRSQFGAGHQLKLFEDRSEAPLELFRLLE